ncbi:DUF4982 domain-containing protein [Ochrovirga pacifica]|uniref:DUF4982 domain-containing protein n=1 Tax=Ochrovirga pacifica TaxID=1042376 RepID=UPI0002EA7DB5|nr:DUF4982 domain-containing protein [Ochrovirga pacifica]
MWRWQEVNEHWNYKEGESVVVEIYSNCEELELFLNGSSLGRQKLTETVGHIYKWEMPFKKGTLVAKGYKDGKEIESRLVTSEKAYGIVLNADSEKINSNYEDVVHVVAELVDAKGNAVKHENKKIEFLVEGPATVLGVDSGWKNSVEKFQSNEATTHNGKLLLIIQAKGQKGSVHITAKAEGLQESTIQVQIE